MFKSSRSRRRRQRGQGMTEYVIIVALIAIGTIGVITIFGDNVRALFANSSNALAGKETMTVTPNEEAERLVEKGLSDFADNE